MLKGNMGCAILAMGDTLKNGGLFLSPVLTILISVISIYNQHLLVSNYYDPLHGMENLRYSLLFFLR